MSRPGSPSRPRLAPVGTAVDPGPRAGRLQQRRRRTLTSSAPTTARTDPRLDHHQRHGPERARAPSCRSRPPDQLPGRDGRQRRRRSPSRPGPRPARSRAPTSFAGTGASAKAGDTVTVQYVLATYSSGKVIQSSWTSQPFTFTLGDGQVIPGWDKGVVGMQVGGRRELIIPPDLGYGATSPGPGIAPNDTLVFVIDAAQGRLSRTTRADGRRRPHRRTAPRRASRLAAATAAADPDAAVPDVPGLDGARPRPAPGRRAPLGHRLRRRRAHRGLGRRVRRGRRHLARRRDLVDWLRQGRARWSTRSPAAPADLDVLDASCPHPRRCAMWARRQAHETAIHRVDAELARRSAARSVPPAFAADGIDELRDRASSRGAAPSSARTSRSAAQRAVHRHGRGLAAAHRCRTASRRRRARETAGDGDDCTVRGRGGRPLPGAVEPRRAGRR